MREKNDNFMLCTSVMNHSVDLALQTEQLADGGFPILDIQVLGAGLFLRQRDLCSKSKRRDPL